MSTSARRTTLHDLPADILESLLVVQPPATLAAAAQSSRLLNAAVSPRVWSIVSQRAFGVDACSTADARAVADRLVCAWWAAAGALVRGVPVHFRRTFIAIRGRSGALIRVRSASDAAVFAMHEMPAHGPPPALEMDFAIAKGAPFPVDGMVARIVAAAVPQHVAAARSPSSSPPRSPAYSPPRSPTRSSARGQNQTRVQMDVFDDIHAAVSANAHIVLNGEVLVTHELSQLCKFDTIDVELPPRLIRTKPGINTLAVEYEGGSAAYWLKSVKVVPAVLPMSPPAEHEPVPLRHVGISTFSGIGGFVEQDTHYRNHAHGANDCLREGQSPRRNRFAYSPFRRLNLGV